MAKLILKNSWVSIEESDEAIEIRIRPVDGPVSDRNPEYVLRQPRLRIERFDQPLRPAPDELAPVKPYGLRGMRTERTGPRWGRRK